MTPPEVRHGSEGADQKKMIIDISLDITPATPRYPGKLAPRRDILMDIAAGDAANCSSIMLDCHVGTHVDAPRHFVGDGITIDEVDIARFCGPCRVVAVDARREIRPEDLDGVPFGVRVLFRTVGSSLLRAGHSDPDAFAYLSPEAAARLVEMQAPLVGIDAFSVDRYGTNEPSHHILLPAGIPILECIDLTEVTPDNYDLIVLPLRIVGSEAAPARAILRSSAG
jgi:arylformamidase